MYDLVIRNARFITGETMDIGVTTGKIQLVVPTIEGLGREELSLKDGQYLSAGWIDDHVHCFEKMSLYYDYPDRIGVDMGVTTVIDAGSTGAENISDFYEYAKKATTNVFALVNISKKGIIKQDELADLSKIQLTLIEQKIKEFPDFIIGLKARMSQTVVGKNDITPLQLAKKCQKENQELPLMVHIGSAPPQLVDILAVMEKGDVLTHCFNGKGNGILDPVTQEIQPFVKKAKAKGVVFDIGHGTDSFNFHVAEKALQAGIIADSISTDIYIRNRENGPVYDLATTMEKMHIVGYSWIEILEKVTNAPAKHFHLKAKGQVKKGFDADFTIFEIHEQKRVLTDSNGNQRESIQHLKPVSVIIGGVRHECKL